MAPAGRETFRSEREAPGDALAPAFRPDIYVLNLRDADVRRRPGDVCVADGIVPVPRDEIGLVGVQPRER